jgi:hypothetical protein
VVVETGHVLRIQYDARETVIETAIQPVCREDVQVLDLPNRDPLALGPARGPPGSPLAASIIAATARSARPLPL